MELILTGDINLMNVDDPAVPFAQVAAGLRAADLVFANLECCLYRPPGGHSVDNEGFYAPPAAGAALSLAGIKAVGIANNVNYGEAAILGSIARLDALGIAHTGAGSDRAAARAPALVACGDVKVGFLQRTSVYWPTNHEARDHSPGVAVIQGHTAYHVPTGRLQPGVPPPNRPGVPPVILTWADPASLKAFTDDVAALRRAADIVVASCHWGLGREVLAYMTEIAHAAIDAGADLVIGHGPHDVLPIELYRGKPILYGLGSFSFHTGHGGKPHGDWLGLMARAGFTRRGLTDVACRFVRHDAGNQTVLCGLDREAAAHEELAVASLKRGARLSARGDEMTITPAG